MYCICIFVSVSSSALKLANSYLTNREQSASFDMPISSLCDVSSRVPQGLVLGPFLFSMFVNNLPNALQSFKSLQASSIKLMICNFLLWLLLLIIFALLILLNSFGISLKPFYLDEK